jgi:monoamine oxidase
MDRLEADVCVVGAGFAGMSAAWRLHQEGLAVVVLEARNRVGGRTWTEYLPDGTHIDRGGAWLGPGQDRAYALAEEMGRPTYPTWYEGDNILVEKGKPKRYEGLVPLRINPWQLANLGIAVSRLDDMAKKVPSDDPWKAAKARELDQQTIGAWVAQNTDSGTGRDMVEGFLTGVFGCDLSEVSMLGALHMIHSNGGINDIGSIKGGHQQDRVLGGTQSILNAVNERLGDRVRLDSPVRDVAWSRDSVEVSGPNVSVHARRAVVAVPIWLSDRILWDPPLPIDRAQLIQRVPPGQFFKIHLVYDEPFWRNDGLNGQTLDNKSPVALTLDGCGPQPGPGVLVLLSGGVHSRDLSSMGTDARRTTVIDEVKRRFGQRGARVEEYVEQNWTDEQWTRGDFCTHWPTGVLTQFGHALRPPLGRLHWAGTETSPIMFGSIDGAIRSGERAAGEVLAAETERVAASG